MIARDAAFLLPLGVTLAFGGDLRVVAGWSLLGFAFVACGRAPRERPTRLDPLPDLADAATLGCLLSLVREARSSLQSTEHVGDGDPVNPWRWGSLKGRSEAEALVNALEGAP